MKAWDEGWIIAGIMTLCFLGSVFLNFYARFEFDFDDDGTKEFYHVVGYGGCG